MGYFRMFLHTERIILCVADWGDDVEGGVTLIVENIWDWRLDTSPVRRKCCLARAAPAECPGVGDEEVA